MPWIAVPQILVIVVVRSGLTRSHLIKFNMLVLFDGIVVNDANRMAIRHVWSSNLVHMFYLIKQKSLYLSLSCMKFVLGAEIPVVDITHVFIGHICYRMSVAPLVSRNTPHLN